MANKRKINYDLFARITANEDIDPNTIVKVIHNACIAQGWDFSASIEEELSADIGTLEDILERDE